MRYSIVSKRHKATPIRSKILSISLPTEHKQSSMRTTIEGCCRRRSMGSDISILKVLPCDWTSKQEVSSIISWGLLSLSRQILRKIRIIHYFGRRTTVATFFVKPKWLKVSPSRTLLEISWPFLSRSQVNCISTQSSQLMPIVWSMPLTPISQWTFQEDIWLISSTSNICFVFMW